LTVCRSRILSKLLAPDRRLDAALVVGAQLDGLEARALQHADDGWHIEILQRVIGDGSEVETRTGSGPRGGRTYVLVRIWT
jgi:hypothetical protein